MTEQTEPLKLHDIAQLCGMNASTTLRFLNALQRRKYVDQDLDTGKYRLTFKLCAIAQNIGTFFDLRSIAMPFLRNVAHVFSESCNLAIDSDMTVVYIEVVKGPNKTLMSTQRIGNVAPLHCTGVGKLFLTEYSRVALEQLIAVRQLTKFTDHTITDPEKLRVELDRIKTSGYAIDNQECEEGARCVAAPIRDFTGKIKAGISVSGPSVRLTDEQIYAHLPFLLETADQISLQMGWSKKN
jgi:DNA-binding IclR family transcriptional regulator